MVSHLQKLHRRAGLKYRYCSFDVWPRNRRASGEHVHSEVDVVAKKKNYESLAIPVQNHLR